MADGGMTNYKIFYAFKDHYQLLTSGGLNQQHSVWLDHETYCSDKYKIYIHKNCTELNTILQQFKELLSDNYWVITARR
jgi:hypothetical protein